MLAVDTETTGIDLKHSARPYFVTTCDDDGNVLYWEFDVDPETREPDISDTQIEEMRNIILRQKTEIGEEELVTTLDDLVFQNPKFDIAVLNTIGLWDTIELEEVWAAVKDTLLAGHLLASNQKHSLDAMVMHYLGEEMLPYEIALKQCCDKARRLARSKLPHWRIAKKGLKDMPSAKEETWKFDGWLPREMAKEFEYPEPDEECEHHWVDFKCTKCRGHQFWTVLREYSNKDVEYTLPLYKFMLSEMREKELEKIYIERLKVLPITYAMEGRGIFQSLERTKQQRKEFKTKSDEAAAQCIRIARSYEVKCTNPRCSFPQKDTCRVCKGKGKVPYKLTLPKTGNNKSLIEFVFNVMKVHEQVDSVEEVKVKTSKKTGAPSLDKTVLETLSETLPYNTRAGLFVSALKVKRKRDTALSYLDGYERYWIPAKKIIGEDGASELEGWYVLHPSLNPTGTSTLRWSSKNPNEQNISKQIETCPDCRGRGCKECNDTGERSLNLRKCFGPLPGREWWSVDAKNIELRFPAYEAEEREMIALFEEPNKPPYYGSNHLLNFHTVYPHIWERELGKTCHESCCKGKATSFATIGPHCKKKFAATYYQWDKNGGFSLQYGAGRPKVDATFHMKGAYDLLSGRFENLFGPNGLNKKCIRFAEKYGYIETIPDVTVDPERGYPLFCTRTEWDSVMPTVPLNYRVQGSAMWWTQKGMIKTTRLLNQWNKEALAVERIVNTSRDAIRRRLEKIGYFLVIQQHDELVFDFPKAADPKKDPKRSNLGRIMEIVALMESSGQDFKVKVPTPCGIEYHANNWGEGVVLK